MVGGTDRDGGPIIDALHLCIALFPLAAYLLLLGAVGLSRRPLLTTGARDLSALGLAVSGLVVAGPMELFLPEAAANRFGGYVWVLLLACYALCLVLIALLTRPRLILYNMNLDQLRPILADVVLDLDSDARWAGDSLTLPQLGVQLHLEPFTALRNTQLVASGPRQSFAGWKRLEIALGKALKPKRVPPNPYAWAMLTVSLLMITLVTLRTISESASVVQSLGEMLRL
jgi:hypothetical protein